MKTPREILLEQHRAATPKLDAIRHECVGQASSLSQNKMSETGKMPVLLLIWRELIFPSRGIWASLAAIWIFIFVANVSQRDRSQMTMAKPSSSPEMVLSFRQQEKMLAELIGSGEPHVAEQPKTFSPRPSSRRQFEIFTT